MSETKKTVRLCSGLSLSEPEVQGCREEGRWFQVQDAQRESPVLTVCEAHLGWAVAVFGCPALVDYAPDALRPTLPDR